jgi:hypothetical protein
VYFKYGNYTHDAGEIDMVNTTMRRMYSRRNRLMFKRWTMTLMGHFCIQDDESNQDDIKDKIEAIKGAYLDGADAILYHDNGTISSHYLKSNNCINGTRVMSLSFPRGGDGEYATGRTYQIQIQGDVPAETGVAGITSFEETVMTRGTGGPLWEYVPRWIGPPQKNIIYNQSPRTVIQYGSSEALAGGWPYPPTPVVNSFDEHTDKRTVWYGSAKISGVNQNLLYPLRWRYTFQLNNVGTDAYYPHADTP